MRALVSLMTLSFQNVRLFKTPSIVLVIDNDYFVYCLFLVFLNFKLLCTEPGSYDCA